MLACLLDAVLDSGLVSAKHAVKSLLNICCANATAIATTLLCFAENLLLLTHFICFLPSMHTEKEKSISKQQQVSSAHESVVVVQGHLILNTAERQPHIPGLWTQCKPSGKSIIMLRASPALKEASGAVAV